MNVFEAQWTRALDCGDGDITVTTSEGKHMQAHSTFLQLCSPVFRAELTGPMREAQTKCVNMDCSQEVAYAFLKFFYVGHLSTDTLTSLEFLADLIRMADFYGVLEDFAVAFAQDHIQVVFLHLLDSHFEHLDEPCKEGFELLKSLRPLVSVQRSIANEVIKRLDLKIGRNVFKSMCHSQAAGVLDMLLEAVEPLVCPPADCATDWLGAEVSQEVIADILKAYPEHPKTCCSVLLEFISIIGSKSRVSLRGPETGSCVRTVCGRTGTLLKVDSSSGSSEPYLVDFGSTCEWFSAEQVLKELPLLLELPRLMQMAIDLIKETCPVSDAERSAQGS